MKKENNYVIIMAGGVGSRFWPMSTPEKPKQFLDITGVGKTLFQMTVARFENICPVENILVVTSARYKHYVEAQCPVLPQQNILLEPMRRNTAPCIAYACHKIAAKNPEAQIVVTPSDHLVTDTAGFHQAISQGLAHVSTHEALLTLGIAPHRPETGYGYIQSNSMLGHIGKVEAFKEKPNLETAQKYLDEGGYFWNAGIFLWSTDTIMKALANHMEALHSRFEAGKAHYFQPSEQAFIDATYQDCPNISIDYGIMEKAPNIDVLPCDFGWSDLGTWGSLWEKTGHDQDGNSLPEARIQLYETKNCIVKAPENKRVVIQGLDDYIVVDQNDYLLICSKKEEQRIGSFSECINKS